MLYRILADTMKSLAPILVHTAGEVWSHTPHVKEESVHLADIPKVVEVDQTLLDKWRTFMNPHGDVNHALETVRSRKVVGRSLEAKITIVSNDKFNASESLASSDALHQLFIVSQVKVVDKSDDQVAAYEHGDAVIEHVDGEKCERYRNHSKDLGTVNESTYLCSRCQQVVRSLV